MAIKLAKKGLVFGFSLICFQAPAHAVDSVSFEFAEGNRTQVARVGLQSDWQRRWWHSDDAQLVLGGYWDFDLAGWRENRHLNLLDNTRDIVDLGATPVFRLRSDAGIGPYAEGGVGLHYLSETYDNNGRHLSGDFQFGSHVGIGYVFRNSLDIGVKLQHISNGGIRHPNDGVNFAVAHLGFHY